MLTTAHEITSTVQGGAIPRFAIDVSGLVKTYDQIRVLDGLDLRVDAGQIFGLLGANGAGKTTAVECLQGLRRPDAGRLRVLGLDPIGDRDRLRLLVGSQLQDSALPDRLRVHEAIAMFDQAAHPRREQVLEQWGLTTSARIMFGDLSGGQRQRLFIALALLNNPQLVFLDELTQGLDASARRDVWDVIRRIRELGTTVVLVSHFADEIEHSATGSPSSHMAVSSTREPRLRSPNPTASTSKRCTASPLCDSSNVSPTPSPSPGTHR